MGEKNGRHVFKKIRFQMIANNLRAVQQQASGCQGHKYQFYEEGVRIWQLDLVTGEKCILLTTEADLKKPETKMQVCN